MKNHIPEADNGSGCENLMYFLQAHFLEEEKPKSELPFQPKGNDFLTLPIQDRRDDKSLVKDKRLQKGSGGRLWAVAYGCVC